MGSCDEVVYYAFCCCVFLCRAGNLPKPYASMGNVQNIMGIMFSSTNFLGMTNLMAVMPLVGECQTHALCRAADWLAGLSKLQG
jgi:hypothetical protein